MRFYGTFGSKHLDGVGEDKYVIIEAEDRGQATQIMQARFGPRYAFIYDSEEKAGVGRFGLVCVNPRYTPLTTESEGLGWE
jgi:hypothetical protein